MECTVPRIAVAHHSRKVEAPPPAAAPRAAVSAGGESVVLDAPAEKAQQALATLKEIGLKARVEGSGSGGGASGGAEEGVCRVIVHDDNENAADDVAEVLRWVGMSVGEAQRAVQQIMEHGAAAVLEASGAQCANAARRLEQLGLTVSVQTGSDAQAPQTDADSVPGADGDPDDIDDLIKVL